MVFRSLFAGLLAAAVMIAGNASAQVLLCPAPSELSANKGETRAEAEKMLERLLIAFDLYGHEGIDEAAIVRAHADTPGALLTKLGNVADRCALVATDDLKKFYEQVPELRRLFLEATLIDDTTEQKGKDQGGVGVDLKRPSALVDLAEALQLERSADLSVRALWRKLWFRSPSSVEDHENRWAVIVASPADADVGWALLGEHQKTWKDVYFQLHQPYYEDSSYHAIVVGKKLPREEAERLLDYVKEMGMLDDSYIWPVPVDKAVNVVSPKITREEIQAGGVRKRLDLSILSN